MKLSMANIVGDSDLTLKLLDEQEVSEGVVYTWQANIFDPFGSNLVSKGRQRARARSLVEAGVGSTVRDAITHQFLLRRLTNIQREELVDSADFTSIYEYEVKVLKGDR